MLRSCLHKMKQWLTCLLFGALLILAGVTDAADDMRPTTAFNILRLGINAANIQTMDPHYAATFGDRLVVDMVFNALIRYVPGNHPEFEPDLAEEIPEPVIIGGRQTWVVKLRRGVFFHASPQTPAYELTADDVVYSFRKSANPRRSAYAGEYSGFQIEKLDRYTCRFILDYPLSPTLFFSKIVDYAGGFIMPKRAVESMGDAEAAKWPVGTGPFRFDGHLPDKRLRLKANDNYFRDKPLLEGVDIYYLPNDAERQDLFYRGQLDVIRGLAETDWIAEARAHPNLFVDIFGVSEVANIHFNTLIKPFDDIRVRQAIAFCLDRDEFLEPFGPDGAVKVFAPVPAKFLPGGLSEKEVRALKLDYGRDLNRSRQLLTEAGYADGFELDVVVSELHLIQKNYVSLKNQLERIGIKLNLRIVDHSIMHRLIRQDLNPIVIYQAWRPNTDVFLQRFFHSESIVVTGTKPDTNFSHYDELDNIIVKARKESDATRQIKLWEYAQIKLLEDMVVYPLHYHPRVYARHSYVDYGHSLVASMALYPQFTERTRLVR